MSVKGFDQKQIPIAIGSLVVVVAVMICILVFGKTTVIPKKEDTTKKAKTKSETTTVATTESTRATTEAPEVEQHGSIIVQGTRAMEVWKGPNTSSFGKYVANVCTFAETLPQCNVYILFAPTSIEFYGADEYHTGNRSQKATITEAYKAITASNVKGVDAYKEIEKYVDSEYCYFRTDHHWTALGSYHAYVAFCKTAKLTPTSLEAHEHGVLEPFVGSYYTWTNLSILHENPDYVDYFKPIAKTEAYRYPNADMKDEEAKEMQVINTDVSYKYICFIEGDNPVTKIKTNVMNGRKIVLIKESYGNCFAPWLCDNFEEVYVIDPRKVDVNLRSFVKTNGITDILFLNYTFVPPTPTYMTPFNKMIAV